jgi:chlorobactene glucosyltransferase
VVRGKCRPSSGESSQRPVEVWGRFDSRNNIRRADCPAFHVSVRRIDRVSRTEPLCGIRAEFLDDVALARTVKRHGGDARFLFAPELLDVRIFKGNADAFWGLTKNIFGAVDHIVMAIPAMFLPIIVYWVPLASVLVGICKHDPALVLAGGSAYAIQAILLLTVRSKCTFRWAKAVFFPAAALPVLCCFTRALYHRVVSGSIVWRGRTVTVLRSKS